MGARGSAADLDRPVHVVHIIHSLGAGGAESALVELAGSARRAEVELTVIALSDAVDHHAAVRLREAGVTVHELHAGRYDLRAVGRVTRLLRRLRPDLVHTHLKHADLVGGLAARRLGLPAVSTLHVIEPPPAGWPDRVRIGLAVLARRRLFARVIAVSSAQQDWYRSLTGRADGLVRIPNGVAHPGPTDPRAVRTELGVRPGELLAVTVSLLRPEKGHALLLDAVRRYAGDPPLVFALAGDGELLPELTDRVAADPILRDRVRLLGYRSDVDALLAAADLVIQPSLADALPTAVISALAAGRPVVATAVGGLPDLITPQCGRLVPAGDPDALAAAVAEVVGDPALRRRLGLAARERHRRCFSAVGWAKQLRALYDEVLGERTPSGTSPDHRLVTARAGDQVENGSPGRDPIRSAAVLSAFELEPADNGKSVVLTGFLRHLADRLGPERVHYLHVGRPLTGLPADLAGIRLHELGRPTRRDQLRSAIMQAGLRGRSLQETFTASATVTAAVGDTLAALDVDLLIMDTIRMAQHVPAGGPDRTRRILYLDDLFSVRYRRMLEVLRHSDTGFDPLGQFGGFIPRRLQPLTRLPASRNLLLRLESRRVARSERRAARASDLPVLLNQREANLLAGDIGQDVAVLPPSLRVRSGPARSWHGAADFAFVGLLSVPHNHDGLSWVLDEVMPALLRERPDARLRVIGHGAGPALVAAAERWAGRVTLHGYVADLDSALAGVAALITPLRFGSGIKIKTLEALARGLPVVSTAVGAEGIVEADVAGLRIADRPEPFARAMSIMADPARRPLESAGARRLFATRFAPGPVAGAYDAVFGTDPRPPSSAAAPMKVSGDG
ncbi:glycosyltransferase [Microlunatus sp. GCM10028923]|uniref:glycosyltransferase n=1 Tax=Microlunatus sp. GCM10028923 TaxID=3273400 RepID=UPI00362201A0